MERITYAQFLRELQTLDPAMRRQGDRRHSRVSWLEGITDWAKQADCEARDGLPGNLPELVTIDLDWITCVPGCDNVPDSDGFQPCMTDGTKVESTPGTWDGKHYVCERCGRIINQHTSEVVGRVPLPRLLS